VSASTRENTPAVTVIVPVRNAEHWLPTLFEALRAQTLDPSRFEVVVVDDASSDGTCRLVEESGIARLMRTERQGGSYAARNVALPEARGTILAFTDADCVPDPTWLEEGLTALADPEVDIVAGRIHVPLGERPSGAALLGVAKHHLDQEHHVFQQGYGATANLWVRREVFDRAGPFDPAITSGGDGEFCRRATAAGARLIYGPEVTVMHPPRSRPMELFQKQFRIGFGVAQLRHRERGEDVPVIWARPGAYVPRTRIKGLQTIEARGYTVTRRRRMRLALVQYVFWQLPLAFGNLAGSAYDWRVRRRAPRTVAT
jgi:glycosyltransferase involved in cell wall biosynthesis